MSANSEEPYGNEIYFFKGCVIALLIMAGFTGLGVGAYFLGRWLLMLVLAG